MSAVKYVKIVSGAYSTADSLNDTLSIAGGTFSSSVTTPALDTATAVAMNIGTANATTINIGRTGQTFNVKGDLIVDGVETLTGGTAFGSALILNEFAAATSGVTTQPSCDLRFKYSYWTTGPAVSSPGYTLKAVPTSAAAGVGDLQWLDANTTERMRLTAGASAKLRVATVDALAAGALTLGGGTATSLTSALNTTLTGSATLTVAGLVTASNGFTMTTGQFAATANGASSLTTSAGALTLTGAVASTWSTAAGALTLSGFAGMNLQVNGGTVASLDSGGAGLVLAANKNLSGTAGTGLVDFSAMTGTYGSPTGTNTINGAMVFAANKGITTTAGTGAFDFSNGSGLFKTSTGAVTIGPGAVGISGATTFAANIGIATTAGTGAFDFSNATGVFSTSTGTNTINGAMVFAANKGVTVTAGTSAFDFSGGSGTFKTSTGAVTIGPGAVGISGAVTLAANIGIATTAGTGAFDLSNATGIFKTSTGAVTIGPGTTTMSGATTFTAAGTALTVNNNASVTGTLTAGALVSPTLDRATATTMAIGGTNTTDLNLSRTGQTTYVLGNLNIAGTVTGSFPSPASLTYTGTASTAGFVAGAAGTTLGHALYISADSTVLAANAAAIGTSHVIGFADSTKTSGQAVGVVAVGTCVPVHGNSNEAWTGQVGMPLYLGTGADAGKVVLTAPTTGIYAPVGYVKDVANGVMLISIKPLVDLGA